MSDQEWVRKMNELRDAQLVTQRLMELNERKWDARFEEWEARSEEWDARFATLTSVVEAHENRLALAEDSMAELRAALSSLIANMDSFIKGLRHNGH
jgi:hypothetical protein